MENCNNRRTGIISALTAYRVGEISFSHPFNILRPYLNDTDYKIPDGLKPIRVSIAPETAELSDDSDIANHGRPVNVTLKFSLRDNSPSEMDKLMLLHNGTYDLVVEYFGGAVAIIRSDVDGYLFDWNDGKTAIECQFTIQNVSGIQSVNK